MKTDKNSLTPFTASHLNCLVPTCWRNKQQENQIRFVVCSSIIGDCCFIMWYLTNQELANQVNGINIFFHGLGEINQFGRQLLMVTKKDYYSSISGIKPWSDFFFTLSWRREIKACFWDQGLTFTFLWRNILLLPMLNVIFALIAFQASTKSEKSFTQKELTDKAIK